MDMVDAPLSNRALPRRSAARKAEEAVKANLDSSDSEGDTVHTAPGSKRRRRRATKSGNEGNSHRGPTKKKLKASLSGEVEIVLSQGSSSKFPISATRTQKQGVDEVKQQSTPAGKDRIQIDDADEESDLTPISSRDASPSQQRTETPLKPESSFKGQIRSHPMFATGQEDLKFSRPTISHSTCIEKQACDAWNFDDLGGKVYVLLNGKKGQTARVFNPSTDGGLNQDRVWWPGISLDDTPPPLRVRLLGTSNRVVEIEHPSADNVLSHLVRSKTRFPTYNTAVSTAGRSSSTKKTSKVDDESRRAWDLAVAELELDIDDDELPSVTELLQAPKVSKPQTKSNSKGKGKVKHRQKSLEWEDHHLRLLDGSDDLTRPPGLEADMEIPGELVLAKVNQPSLTDYWPAMVENYIPPEGKGKAGKYTVRFFDGIQMQIPRSHFYTQEEDGFSTCQCGKIESYVKDETNDEEEDVHMERIRQTARMDSSPAPAPKVPPAHKFNLLDARQQFAYVKIYLQEILMDRYAPIREKRAKYIKGGKARAEVTKNSVNRGLMDPRLVETLHIYLNYWCLRHQLDINKTVDNGDIERTKPSAKESEDQQTNGGDSKEEFSSDRTLAVAEEAQPSKSDEHDKMDVTEAEVPSPLPTPPSPHEPTAPLSSPPQEPPPSSFGPLDQQFTTNDEGDTETTVFSMLSDLPETVISDVRSTLNAEDDDPDIPEFVDASEVFEFSVKGDTEDMDRYEDPARPRQRGNPDYEALSSAEKLGFCADILLPEAIRQILLFCNGFRTRMEVLSPQGELELFRKGQELLDQRDWVFDVIRLRERKQGLYAKQIQQKVEGLDRTSSRAGRVRKNVKYHE